MAHIADFVPKRDDEYGAERMFVCGESGSGKTTFIRKILAQLEREREFTLILDSKPDWKPRAWWQRWKGKGAIALPRLPITRLPAGTYVLQTSYPDYADPRLEPALVGLLKRGACTLVVDEGGDFSKGSYALPVLAKVIREGRALGVRVIFGCQRPADVPIIALSSANKIACFTLESERDRKRMGDRASPAMLKRPAGEHDFWWLDKRNRPRRVVLIRQ